ncbi:hypothetical protein PENTCL1PPCAC_30096, partial [Pristionchus entomophagus]
RTHRFLKRELGAVEILHLNKIGENSRPNGMAFLFGKLIANIKRGMFDLPIIPADWTRKEYCATYLDDKGFILKQFEE